MTTQTKTWAEMTTQDEQTRAVAAMMGWRPATKKTLKRLGYEHLAYDDVLESTIDGTVIRPFQVKWLTDYTACFEGPVAWAKAQGCQVSIFCRPEWSQVSAWIGSTCYALIEDCSPEAICRAIYEAWRASR